MLLSLRNNPLLATFITIALAATLSITAPTYAIDDFSEETLTCIECHSVSTKGIYQEWGTSKHYRAKVGCFECHQAKKGEVDAYEHGSEIISVIVSPKDCSRCHTKEVQEFSESHHAKAGTILGSLDNFLADIVEGDWDFYGGSALTVSGCKQCHGSIVEVNKDGSLKPAGWPNSGIGRFNPDGSIGACSACHQRHSFSAEQARRPENCGKCHLGPDHPQKEVYEESKHGIAYRAYEDDLNMDKSKWVLGEDYTAAPTCATCHMSAVRTGDGELVPVTHDVGMRISWNNRPPKSVRPEISDAKLGLEKMAKVGWEERRDNMKKVCNVCHTPNYVNNFYEQYDGVIELYNKKFAGPGLELMKVIYDNNLITKMKFDDDIEWTWWEIWHHEGRRARHGAAMMAPDYTHWHGMYEVAKHFYSKMIPEAKELAEVSMKSEDAAIAKGGKALHNTIEDILHRKEHAWYIGQLPKEEAAKRKKDQIEFKKRYGK